MEQALADYAVLVAALKTQWNASESHVIAFGGRFVCFILKSLLVCVSIASDQAEFIGSAHVCFFLS